MSAETAAEPVTAFVFAASEVCVTFGANQGDPVGAPDEAVPGDIYQLLPGAAPFRLVLCAPQGGAPVVAAGSDMGEPGQTATVEARFTLIAPDGEHVDLLTLILPVQGRILLPLSPLRARTDYTLADIDIAPEIGRLGDLLCLSFAAGTRITLDGGALRAIEAIRPGDAILTRDHGAQAVRWAGKITLRAEGAQAPVVIPAGSLGNLGDLTVSPYHRLFLYRPEGADGKTPELLVQAKHLVDGTGIRQRTGGFVDYHCLVFDRHEIIYAEGIPCESLLVTAATLVALPEALASELHAHFPALSQRPLFATEIARPEVDLSGGAEALFDRRQPP